MGYTVLALKLSKKKTLSTITLVSDCSLDLTVEPPSAIFPVVFTFNKAITHHQIGTHHEANIPTQQQEAKTNTWFSCSDEHPKWSKCHQAKNGKRPEKAHRVTLPYTFTEGRLSNQTLACEIDTRRCDSPSLAVGHDQKGPLITIILLFIQGFRQLKNTHSSSLLACARAQR